MNSKIPPLYSGSKPKMSDGAQTPLASQEQAPASSAPALSGESLLQRLRYFENLVEQKDQYIDHLKALVARQGAAVPSAYFAPLTGPGGTYNPKQG